MAGSDGTQDCHTVCIDTSLGTGLITAIPSSETVPDFKKRLLHEHLLCFPHHGNIKIDGLKVKRRGKFYYLTESMLVKRAFDGVTKNWFIHVDVIEKKKKRKKKSAPSNLGEKVAAGMSSEPDATPKTAFVASKLLKAEEIVMPPLKKKKKNVNFVNFDLES